MFYRMITTNTDYPDSVNVGPGHVLFSAKMARLNNRDSLADKRAYQDFLRNIPGVEEYLYKLRDRNLVSVTGALWMASILAVLSDLPAHNLIKWKEEGIDANDLETFAQIEQREFEERADRPINRAKQELRDFLASKDVFYTGDEFKTLWDSLVDKIDQSSQPFA